MERVPEVEATVSATTRDRRPGEQNGREYWFLNPEEFLARIESSIEEASNRLVAAGQAEQAKLFGRIAPPAKA